MIYLKKLSLDDGMEIYRMLQEIAANDNRFHNTVYGMSYLKIKNIDTPIYFDTVSSVIDSNSKNLGTEA